VADQLECVCTPLWQPLEPEACERFMNPIGCKLGVTGPGDPAPLDNVTLTDATKND
jgi:hypothetical protein